MMPNSAKTYNRTIQARLHARRQPRAAMTTLVVATAAVTTTLVPVKRMVHRAKSFSRSKRLKVLKMIEEMWPMITVGIDLTRMKPLLLIDVPSHVILCQISMTMSDLPLSLRIKELNMN
jgi:hypothetical protein